MITMLNLVSMIDVPHMPLQRDAIMRIGANP